MKLYKFESILKNTAITVSEDCDISIEIFIDNPIKKKNLL